MRGVGDRPNGVAVAGGRLWVISFTARNMHVIDRTSERAERTVRVGPGASDITSDGDHVWVAATRADRLVH